MNRLAGFVGLAALSLSACVPASDGLVGRTLPPYPDGLEELQGTCIAAADDPAAVCAYSVAVLGHRAQGGAGQPVHVVAQRNAGYDGQMPRWTVSDAAPYPAAATVHALQVSTCRFDGEDDPHVVALVRHVPDREWSGDVAWARRLALATGRFAPVDPSRVACLNEAAY